MKHIILLFSILLLGCSQPTPSLLNNYKKEISALKTEIEIDAYWTNLLKLDQESLKIADSSVKVYDSISISNMIRTALMFEIHGSKFYKPNNVVPEMHLSHNSFGPSIIAFWPLIKECVTIRGNRKLIQYPAYQLESFTNDFYDYSIYDQKEKHDYLLNKLNKIETTSVSNDLFDALNYQLGLQKLKELEVIGKWQREQIKGLKESGFFEFVEMSDNSIYYRKNERIQKLEFIKTVEKSNFYRVEKEPFGWVFKLKENGDLSLIDNENYTLMNYSRTQ